MRNTLLGSVLAFFLCGTNAFGQVSARRRARRNARILAAFFSASHRVRSLHGPRHARYKRGRRGLCRQGCYSELGTEQGGRAFAIDWSVISAVNFSDAAVLYVSGQLVRAARDPGAWHYANFHLYFPDAKLTRSVSNALALLRRSCERRSRFD